MAEREKLDELLAHKFDILCEFLATHERLAVAFSGGVDSTLLLKVAHDVLGDGAIAITGRSPSIPKRELDITQEFCRAEGIEHVIVDTHEFEIDGFDHNPPDRCYYCKRELMRCIRAAAEARDVWVIAEGSNLDDDGDYRPGFRAVTELDVLSPLRGAGFTKEDVRALAKYLGLSVWNKPAFACLNTRFAYGDLITPEKLSMVDAAEDALQDLGFKHVRVRVQDDTARIEVPIDDIERLAANNIREAAVSRLLDIGFTYITLDLQGYRTGSMNATLNK